MPVGWQAALAGLQIAMGADQQKKAMMNSMKPVNFSNNNGWQSLMQQLSPVAR